jgi:hypothetical protein
MVQYLSNIGVNKIKVMVFNSGSEEEFMLNDYDTECKDDIPVYDDDDTRKNYSTPFLIQVRIILLHSI